MYWGSHFETLEFGVAKQDHGDQDTLRRCITSHK